MCVVSCHDECNTSISSLIKYTQFSDNTPLINFLITPWIYHINWLTYNYFHGTLNRVRDGGKNIDIHLTGHGRRVGE